MSSATTAVVAVVAVLADPTVQIGLACVLVSVLIVALLRSSRKAKDEQTVYPVIAGMAIGNPPYRCTQDQALAIAKKCPGVESVKPVLDRIYGNSRIDSRYFAVPDFTPDKAAKGDPMFFPSDESFQVPVDTRLDKFKEKAVPLVSDVARRAIKEAGIEVSDVSKLVVVSSTGFLGPGLDCELIKNLGLTRSVDRTLIGFMGCAAAINGFRNANDFVTANPGKYALMICVELSSVHTTFGDNINDAIHHAIFADGCAAAVLKGVRKSEATKGTLAIVGNHAWLMEGTENGITLAIKPNGITCTLSKLLPHYIARNIAFFADGFLKKHNLNRDDVDFWCVHPGGRRIIEEVQNGLGLTEEQTADSWAVLAEYGNMLSPSVMFVLSRVFKRHNAALAQGKPGYQMGMAFSISPGVGAEGILLKQI